MDFADSFAVFCCCAHQHGRFNMGFILSILYFVTHYLTSPIIFGPLADAHVEMVLAILISFISLFKLKGSVLLKAPQLLALVGLAFAGSLSVVFGMHWISGALQAFPAFIPCAFGYILVCLHCNSQKKLQALVCVLLFVCLFVIARGFIDLHYGVSRSCSLHSETTEPAETDLNSWDMEHPYLLGTGDNSGESVYRLRGLGLIHDPNDFGQLVVCVVPLVFIFWRTKRTLGNIAFVILPVSTLLYGAFLTHSRGALLALIAMAIVAARRRIGTLPALLLACGLFAAAMALNFTGGRDISAEAGADRTELWSTGLQLLKSHPLFGVGLDNMADYTATHHTAHNSVVVCAAELGIFGLYFWCLFLFSSVRDALAVASPAKVSETEPMLSEERPFPMAPRKTESVDKAEINRLGRLLVLSFTGFLVAGWFLSRAYVMTYFLLGGMVEVVYEMALQRGMIAPHLRLTRVLFYTGGLAISLVLTVYIMLRVTNLMH
jgi:hypothetical protein